jgi:two-component system response regulator RegX3
MSAKILVVDDDVDLLDVVSYVLRRQQFEVVTATDGLQALEQFERERPDLIVLDVNMPGLDGFEVCRRIRAVSDVPIIMLTVRNEDVDVVGALRLGADDYVTKPFSTSQLVARIQAVLRRAAHRRAEPQPVQAPAGLQLDLATHSVRWRGQTIPLDVVEYKVLDYLVRHAGRAIPPEELIDYVWGAGHGSPELLRIYLRRLREKLESDPDNPRVLRAEAGRGLVFDPSAAPAPSGTA